MLKLTDSLVRLLIFLAIKIDTLVLTPIFHWIASFIDKILNRYSSFDDGWKEHELHDKTIKLFENIKIPFIVSLVVSICTQVVVNLIFG